MMTLNDSFHRVMEQYGGDYGARVLKAYATWQLIHPWYNWAKAKYEARVETPSSDTYLLKISGNDNIYYELNDWVLAQMPPVERKDLEIRTVRSEPYVQITTGADTRDLETTIAGHPITVSRTQKETKDPDVFGSPVMTTMPSITFKARSPEGRDAVVAFLSKMAEKYERPISEDDERPWMLTPMAGGRWDYRYELPARPLTSVMLKNGQLDRVIADMQAFLDNEEHYLRLSQPWHRGYLFYGPPGTGKTSMARALSDHFKLPMYWLSLADVGKDQDLQNLISRIESKSILLLEDIDAFDTATDRDSEGHASIAALLNALDGVWTPNGLITIMTTNKPEELDAALIRAGRVGLAERFDNMDMDQVLAMGEYAGWLPEDPEDFVGKSPAQFMESASRALLGLEDSEVDDILQSVLNSIS